jgi:alpha-L-rhamnosidase
MPTSIRNLTIGKQYGQLVTGEMRPSLSWQLVSVSSDVIQQGYEIEWSHSLDFTNVMARSGFIKSSSVIQAPWVGTSLKSREIRYARVRAQVKDEWTSWSASARIEAGLLSNLDWDCEEETTKVEWPHNADVRRLAQPITLNSDIGAEEMSPTLIFRRTFNLSAQCSKARLYITAYGLFEVTINGMKISGDLLNPGWTTYNKRLPYVTYDVAKFLSPGENVITAQVADGWYRGQIGLGVFRNFYGNAIALIAQLEVEQIDGKKFRINTDDKWKVSTGAVRRAGILEGSYIDFKKEKKGWEEVSYDDSKWETVSKLDNIVAKLYPISTEPIRVTEIIEVATDTVTNRGSHIYDFGQNATGFVEVTVKGEAGSEVVVTHAEVLTEGELNREILEGAVQEDTHILDNDEVRTLTPVFTYHGFRYAEIATEAQILKVRYLVVHSDVHRTGRFECSNPALNRLAENAAWSERANWVSLPTGCSNRDERTGWVGDSQMFSAAAVTMFDSESFFANWLVDVDLNQYPDGSIPHCAPDLFPGANTMHYDYSDNQTHIGTNAEFHMPRLDQLAGRAGWGDTVIIIPWIMYESYGDKDTLRSMYPAFYKWVEYLERKSATDGLIPAGEFQFGDWLDPDAPWDKPNAAKCDSTLISNIFYSFSARLMSRVASVLDRTEDAKRFGELAEQVAAATWAKYGKEIATTQTGAALAIKLEIVPANQLIELGKALAALVDKTDGKISTGFLGTYTIMPALSMAGQHEAAYKLLLNEKIPGWLYPISKGATSMWERWDGIREDGSMPSGNLDGMTRSMISFNHYIFGSVADWMYRTLAGIAPNSDKPGYEEILFAPRPHSTLKWAQASIETRFGPASIRWDEISFGKYEAKISIPPGSIGLFIGADGNSAQKLGSGTHEIIF